MSDIQHDHNADEIDSIDDSLLSEKAQSPTVTQPVPPATHQGAVVTLKEIALSPDGILSPQTHTEAWRIAEVFLKSRAIPKQFDNVAQVFMALQFLRGIGFGSGTEVAALRQCTIINGTLSIWGDLPLALCRRSGKLLWITETLYTEDYTEICFDNKNLGQPAFYARCKVMREGDPAFTERLFSQSDAKTAGLWKKSGPWSAYPNRMLQMRARSWCLKDTFPDCLAGISIAEYDHNMLFDGGGSPMKITEPAKGVLAEEINREFLGTVAE